MAVGFRRSSGHVRSTSLPCPSHPLFSNLQSAIQSLFMCQHEYSPSYSWLGNTLTHLERLLAGLHEILRLPESQSCLHRHRASAWVDALLNQFLLLADAYAQLRDAVVCLHQLIFDIRVASRRNDEKGLAVATRERKKLEKDVRKLVSSIRELGKAHDPAALVVGDDDNQVVGTMREVRAALYSASAAVFACVVGLSSSSFGATTTTTTVAFSSWLVVRRVAVSPKIGQEERWKEMDGSMADMESRVEKVLRRLVSTRVLLLNVLEPM